MTDYIIHAMKLTCDDLLAKQKDFRDPRRSDGIKEVE